MFFFLFFSFFLLHHIYKNTIIQKQINKHYIQITIIAPKQSKIYRTPQEQCQEQLLGIWKLAARPPTRHLHWRRVCSRAAEGKTQQQGGSTSSTHPNAGGDLQNKKGTTQQ